MSWNTIDGRPVHRKTGATAQRNRVSTTTVGSRRGHDKTTGTMAEHRAIKRAQAEGRNEVAIPERRKAFRRRDDGTLMTEAEAIAVRREEGINLTEQAALCSGSGSSSG